MRQPTQPVATGKNVSSFRRRQRHKFYARPQELDGFRFDSKKEAEYYRKLKLRQAAGDIVMFLRQVPFHLPGGVKIVVDFQEFHADGTVHFVDTKGVMTEAWLAKKRIAESIYPIEIEIV